MEHSAAEKLENAKIKTIGDLINIEAAKVKRIVVIKFGKQIRDYAG